MMASKEAHEAIRLRLKAAGSPAGDPENYAIIRNSVDRALGWMDGPQIVGYLSSGDWVDGASLIDQKIAGYEAQKKATDESVKRAETIASRFTSASERSQKGAVEAGFSTAAAQGGTTAAPAPAPSDGQIPVSGIAQWLAQRLGITPAEAIARLESDITGQYLDAYLAETRPKAGSTAAPPVARFGFQEVGGRILRTNDLTGAIEDTGISAPGFTSIQVQPTSGDLTGINAQGKFEVISPGYGFKGIDPTITAAEDRRRFDVGFGENQRQFDIGEAGTNRRALLNAQSAGFQSVNQLAPQLGNLALNQAQFTKDTLRTAPDYLARAFFQQGQTSPLPQVTQADVNNQLSDLFTRYNQTLAGFNAGTPAIGQTSSPAAQPPAGTGSPAPATSPGFQNAVTFQGSEDNPVSPQAGLAAFLATNPGFASQGGLANLVAGGQIPAGFVAQAQAAPSAPSISFAPPQLPVPPRQTQGELQALERSVRPPAVNAVMSGQSAAPPRFGFALPTAQNLASLTTEDAQAYNTALGTQFNETLENVQGEVQRRARNPEVRRRAVVAGFQ